MRRRPANNPPLVKTGAQVFPAILKPCHRRTRSLKLVLPVSLRWLIGGVCWRYSSDGGGLLVIRPPPRDQELTYQELGLGPAIQQDVRDELWDGWSERYGVLEEGRRSAVRVLRNSNGYGDSPILNLGPLSRYYSAGRVEVEVREEGAPPVVLLRIIQRRGDGAGGGDGDGLCQRP